MTEIDPTATTWDGTTSPEVEPPPREWPPVDVVQGDRVRTFRGLEVIAERELEPAGAVTGEHTAVPPEAPVAPAQAPEPEVAP